MDPRHIVAVDIGASKTLLSVRPAGQSSDDWQVDRGVMRTATDPDPVALADWISSGARQLRGATPIAIGVALPGPLDAETGVVTRSSNLGWDGVPLAEMLSQRLGAPTVMEDDANSAALGEWRFGAGERVDPFAYLTVSSGIGGGIVVGGAVVRGAQGNAGEVGHIVIDPQGPPCACGRRGDIESFAGGVALERRARAAWPSGRTPDGSPAPRTAAEVFAAADGGDATARRIVEDATRAIAMAMAALAAVLEPRRVVVGGSIGMKQRAVIHRAAELAREMVMAENGRSLEVHSAALGEESVLAGAATLAQRRAERS